MPDGSPRAPLGFSRFRRRAERDAADQGRLQSLVSRASRKLARQRPHLAALRDDVPALLRLLRAYGEGDYRAVPWRTLVLTVGALLYFLSPLDTIPDFIPFLGWLDDAAVVGFVLKSIGRDVRRFEAWENEEETDKEPQQALSRL